MSATVVTLASRMDHISLRVPADPAFHGTLRLVVGGVGSRLRLPYEQVNELQLAVETLVTNRAAAGAELVLEMELDGAAAALLVGPFAPAADAGGQRVLERLVRTARVVDREDGCEWVELEVGAREEPS
jgi:hypothetical protein